MAEKKRKTENQTNHRSNAAYFVTLFALLTFFLYLFQRFTARRNGCIASAVLATAIPSVCLSHAGIVSKRLHVARCICTVSKMCLVL